jgi:hypothetical protein
MATSKPKPRKISRSRLVDYPKHVEAIGMIAIETVDLELELAGLFAQMLMLKPSVGRAIFLSPKSEQARLDIFRDAANAEFSPNPRAKPKSPLEQQKAAALSKVKGMISRSQDAVNRRHRVIHDEWEVSDVDQEIQRRVVDGKVTREAKPTPINELEDQIHSLRVLIDDVYDLAREFRARPPRMIDMKKSTTKAG